MRFLNTLLKRFSKHVLRSQVDMKRPSIVITGAGGEVGHALIEHFTKEDTHQVIGIDLREVYTPENPPKDFLAVRGDITSRDLIEDIFTKHEVHQVFHLAAVLSSGGERNPEKTHHVNVEGSFNLISAAHAHGKKYGRSVTFIYPSTIATYGIPTLEEKNTSGKLSEDQYLNAITMYGINKLYVEHLGRYYSTHYKLLDSTDGDVKLDFRAVRFPGLMSSETVPSGGTSDYGSEMIHAAAQNKAYSCFVSPTAKLPFMTMPDGIRALIELSKAPRKDLTRCVYNVGAFAVTAAEIRDELTKYFPHIEVSFAPNRLREQIVDTWPGDIDDSAANRDWGWKAEHSFTDAFGSYLIPGITKKYQ